MVRPGSSIRLAVSWLRNVCALAAIPLHMHDCLLDRGTTAGGFLPSSFSFVAASWPRPAWKHVVLDG
eukprot:jgi/Botrbrau1/18537/Bobra.0598s0001.1